MIKRIVLIVCTIALAGVVTVAPARAGDERRCVSQREYRDVQKGWRQARVANHFDTNGIRVFRDVSGDRTTVWKYRKCSAWGPGGWYVGVGYHNNGSGNDPYMRVWIKCPNNVGWIVLDGQCDPG